MATKKEEIVEVAESIVEEVKQKAEAAVEEAKSTAKKAAPKAKEAAEKVEKTIKAAAKKAEKAVEEVREAAEDTAEKAEKAVKAAAKTAEKTAKDIKDAAGEGAEKAEKAVKASAKAVGKTAKNAAEKIEAAAVEVAEKAAKQVEKTAKKVEKAADSAKAAARKSKAAKESKADFSGAPRLKQRYGKEVAPVLMEQFGYKNVMEIPKLEKIILNMGLGVEKDNPKGIEAAAAELGIIAGQKPVVTKAKKSVANFKVREGMNVGAMVTLRGNRMYYFADKLMNIVLPRVRDFRGVSEKSFDGRGNYAMGVKEQLIFPEINYDDVDKIRGMNIVFVTSAKTDEEAKALLTLLGMPFVQA